MPKEEIVEKVQSVSKGSDELERVEPDKAQFDAMIEQQNQVPDKVAQEQEAAKPTLLQEVAQNDRKSKVTQRDLTDRIHETSSRVEQTKEVLSSTGENVKLKRSHVRLLNNHLTHIDDNIKSARSIAGLETAEFKDKTSVHPVVKFFGTLNHQQIQLDGLGSHVDQMASEGKGLSTEKILSIHLKVGQIQAQLEFFTNLLNKSLESVKTMMNIQV